VADRNNDILIRLQLRTQGDFKTAEASAKAMERELGRLETAQRSMAANEAAAYREQAARDAKRSDSLAKAGRSMQLLGLASIAAGGVAIKSFADFDAAMSEVQAATHETSQNMGQLREAALKAGKDTVYSATEAAGAISELSKAGVSTTDILGGGLSGALNLAAAGGIDVGEAAETAASAMTQFGLSGKDVGHIADLLAAGAGKAQGSVSDLGAALNQSGLVASQMGLGIEETTGTLAAFASAGLTGSDSGTSFKTMLLSLANPSKAATETMTSLGIAAYDAQGNFVGTERLAGQLQAALGGLSQEQRDSALATIFGSDAIRAANVLYTQGSAGIGKWTAAVNDTGYAADTARVRTDNLRGDLERLKGSLETAFIAGGEGAGGVLRTLVQLATQAVDSFSDLPPELQSAAAGAAVVGGGLVAMGGAALEAGQKIVEVKETMEALGLTAGNLKTAFGKVTSFLGGPWGLAITGAVVLLGAFGASAYEAHKQQEELRGTLDQTTGAITSQTKALVAQTLQQDGTLRQARMLGVNLQTVTDAALGNADAIATLQAKYDAAVAAQKTFTTQNGIAAGSQNLLNTATNKTASSLDVQVRGLGNLIETTGRSAGVISDQAAAAAEVADAAGTASGATTDLTGATTGLAEASTVAANAASNLSDAERSVRSDFADTAASFVSVGDALKTAQDQVDAKVRESAQAQADASKSTKDSWEDYAKGVTASFDQVIAQLEKQVTSQGDWERNMILLAGRVSDGTLDSLRKLGPEGSALVADLVNRSADELARFDDLTTQSLSSTTDAWATKLREAEPVLAAAARDLGEKTADGYRQRLADGTASVEQIAQEYKAALDQNIPSSKTTLISIQGANQAVEGVKSVKSSIDALQDKTITLKAILSGSVAPAATLKPGDPGYGVRLKATGGYISGPGTGTSDSIPALLSNGEYVVRAAATGRHRGLLEAINRDDPSVPRFAAGGAVGVTVNMPSQGKLTGDLYAALKGPAQQLQKSALEQAVLSQSVGAVGKGVERWRGVVLQALAMMGQPASLADTTLRRMNQESGGNPNAINLWDSNAKAGHPSQGLMQTIQGTFQANHFPGTSWNILDPLANILASMRYAISRYGSLAKAYNKAGGYAEGGPVSGEGTGTSDSIPALLSNGEFVVNAHSTSQHRGLLEAINAQRFATGGIVGRGARDAAGTSPAGPTNGLNLAAYLAQNMVPAPLKVDDSELRQANASLTTWTSNLALAQAKLKGAQAEMDRWTDEIRDAEGAVTDAIRDRDSATDDLTRAQKAQLTAREALNKANASKDADRIAEAQRDVTDANKDAATALAAQTTATKAVQTSEERLATAKKVGAKASGDLALATDAEASAATAAATAKDTQAAAEEKLNQAKAEALSYAKQIATAAMSGTEITGLFTVEDTGRALKFAEAAYKASVAQAQATTEAESYQSAIDQVAAAGAKLAATQAANGASYATQKATVAATRAEVDALARSYGFTAEQAAALAESAVPLANSGQTLVDSLTQQLKAVQDFSRSVGTLRALGLSQGLIDQILQAGPEKGLALAQELISGGSDMVKKLNDLQTQLVTASNALGTSAAQAAYSPAGAPPVIARGTRTTRAAGGPVHGPGTGTSDSVPAYLSNGEYVVKAAAVSRYGMTLFDDLNAMRLAGGGQVPYYAATTTRAIAGRFAGASTTSPAEAGGTVIHGPMFAIDTVKETVDVDQLWQRAPRGVRALGAGGGR